MDEGDADSEVALVTTGEDDYSLSSIEDDDGANDAPTVLHHQQASFDWGTPDSPLYQAMQNLVVTARSSSCRMPNPSAAQADELAKDLYTQVHETIVPTHGTVEQKEIWNDKATTSMEQRHEWIASFFLHALLSS